MYFADGYQAALLDIQAALMTDGEDGVREWLRNNIQEATPRRERRAEREATRQERLDERNV